LAVVEPDTEDLDALLASLNISADRLQTLWLTFLGLTLYLAITALATTHRMLLLGEPQALPIVNIRVELLPFYVIAPLFYFIFHFYLLIVLALLARTIAVFERELRRAFPIGIDQELCRARAGNALFLQLLIGMKDERAGVNGIFLGTIAIFTIILAPLATLILMQMMFLPYHSFRITWWHRGIVAGDLALSVVMWSLFFRYSGMFSALLPFRNRPRLRLVALWSSRLSLIAVIFWLSGWEGRWAGEPWITRADAAGSKKRVVYGMFPTRLLLYGETIVGRRPLRKPKKRDHFARRRFCSHDQTRCSRLGGRGF
jgi:hypothetical protein